MWFALVPILLFGIAEFLLLMREIGTPVLVVDELVEHYSGQEANESTKILEQVQDKIATRVSNRQFIWQFVCWLLVLGGFLMKFLFIPFLCHFWTPKFYVSYIVWPLSSIACGLVVSVLLYKKLKSNDNIVKLGILRHMFFIVILYWPAVLLCWRQLSPGALQGLHPEIKQHAVVEDHT